MAAWVYVTVIVLAVIGISYLVTKRGVEKNSGEPMPGPLRRILIGYLLTVSFALTFMLISLTSLEFPPVLAQLTQQETTPLPAGATADTVPRLLELSSQVTSGTPPTTYVMVHGQNFTPTSKVRFNGQEVAQISVKPDLIKAQLRTEDVLNQGSLIVDVISDNVGSNSLVMNLGKPRARLNVFVRWRPWITQEVQLFLLVLCAGALGSYVHALRSLADFIGNRTLVASWFWWYITRPFLGMAVALMFYALLRGGFLAGTPADARIVNPFGVLAVGALVGMFSDNATQKLAEIFDTLFTTADARKDKLNPLDAPVIDRLIPDKIAAGAKAPVLLTIFGARLSAVKTVRLNADERKPESVTENELIVKLRPEDLLEARQIMVTAVNSQGTASTDATLEVVTTDLKVPPTELPAAIVNTTYTHVMSATGGTAPYWWSMVTAPKWLTIDQRSGMLHGTAKAPGSINLVVMVTDAAGVTTTSPELTLSVT